MPDWPHGNAPDPLEGGPAAGDGSGDRDAEFARVEQLLRDRVRSHRLLAEEVERRGALVRDLTEELGRLRAREASVPKDGAGNAAEPAAGRSTSAVASAPSDPGDAFERGERDGLRLRVADAELALAARADVARALAAANMEVERLGDIVVRLRRRVSELEVRAVEAEGRSARERDIAATLAIRATAHDSVLDRLRKQMVREEERHLELQQEIVRLRDDRERLRAELAGGEDEHVEATVLRERVQWLEGRLREANAAVLVKDAELARSARLIDDVRGALAELARSVTELSTSAGEAAALTTLADDADASA